MLLQVLEHVDLMLTHTFLLHCSKALGACTERLLAFPFFLGKVFHGHVERDVRSLAPLPCGEGVNKPYTLMQIHKPAHDPMHVINQLLQLRILLHQPLGCVDVLLLHLNLKASLRQSVEAFLCVVDLPAQLIGGTQSFSLGFA